MTGLARLLKIRTNGKPCHVIHRHYNAKGDAFFVEISAMPILDEQGRVSRFIESHRDITRHIEMERQLKHLAEINILTGTHNQLRFQRELENAITLAKRQSKPLAVIILGSSVARPPGKGCV